VRSKLLALHPRLLLMLRGDVATKSMRVSTLCATQYFHADLCAASQPLIMPRSNQVFYKENKDDSVLHTGSIQVFCILKS
jgi:hypothetical protein